MPLRTAGKRMSLVRAATHCTRAQDVSPMFPDSRSPRLSVPDKTLRLRKRIDAFYSQEGRHFEMAGKENGDSCRHFDAGGHYL
ncbi:hypothetical protein BaRGS_00024972 [Batillaria attramentaria]|uniref:Uncharacterized protein n=1 Tax=Batillaria attramentaria TaxID=370345 RepID=A0ABD0K9Y4_9CAEN